MTTICGWTVAQYGFALTWLEIPLEDIHNLLDIKRHWLASKWGGMWIEPPVESPIVIGPDAWALIDKLCTERRQWGEVGL